MQTSPQHYGTDIPGAILGLRGTERGVRSGNGFDHEAYPDLNAGLQGDNEFGNMSHGNSRTGS